MNKGGTHWVGIVILSRKRVQGCHFGMGNGATPEVQSVCVWGRGGESFSYRERPLLAGSVCNSPLKGLF